MVLILVKYTAAVRNLLEADDAPAHGIYHVLSKPNWRIVSTTDTGLIAQAAANPDAYILGSLSMGAQRFINKLPPQIQDAVDQLVPDATRMTLADLVEDLTGTEIVP